MVLEGDLAGGDSFREHLEAALRRMRKEPGLQILFQDGEDQDPQRAINRIARDQLELVALSILLQNYQRHSFGEPSSPPPDSAAEAQEDEPEGPGEKFDAKA